MKDLPMSGEPAVMDVLAAASQPLSAAAVGLRCGEKIWNARPWAEKRLEKLIDAGKVEKVCEGHFSTYRLVQREQRKKGAA